jgi:hypothetical protein
VRPILDNHMPSHSYILDQDIAYHLGQREDYHLRKAEDAVRSAAAPDVAFLSFDISRKEILAGQYYKANCRIEGRRIAVVGKEGSDKQQRTIKTVNRDSDFMDDSAFYAFNMMDARRLDYACIFGPTSQSRSSSITVGAGRLHQYLHCICTTSSRRGTYHQFLTSAPSETSFRRRSGAVQ